MTDGRILVERIWTHHAIWCAIIAVPMGHRNGYVRVPDEHPLRHMISEEARIGTLKASQRSAAPEGFPQDAWDAMADFNANHADRITLTRTWEQLINVHGGVTFASEVTDMDEWFEGQGDGAPPGLWLGFDTAHAWDSPDPSLINKLASPSAKPFYHHLATLVHTGGIVWTTDMMVAECESMADQLRALPEAHQIPEVFLDALS